MMVWLVMSTLVLQVTAANPPRPAAADTQPASEQTGTSQTAVGRLEIAGQVSVLVDALPRRDAVELRPQAGVEITAYPNSVFRLKLEGFVEALAADRGGWVGDAAVRIREAWIEAAGDAGDLRVGYGRLIWGRLDEVQPSDVINPLDTARYLFDGRSAARLPVAFVRGRVIASEKLTVEGVLVPVFRRGTFDELDESSSPFNLMSDLVLPATFALASPEIRREKPGREWANISGGGRVLGTVGRVDIAAGVFRGYDGFGVVAFEPEGLGPGALGGPGPAVIGQLVERYPRFTMMSGDFETVVGDWAWRGEAAFFRKAVPSTHGTGGVLNTRAVDAGVGFDRRSGEFRVFGSAVLHREWTSDGPTVRRTDLSLVGSIERQFSRDRYLARVFAVVNPGDASGFVRGLIVSRLGDNIAVEFSAAAFVGEGDDTLSRFRTRDFVLARLRLY